jgi:hypothetical protein
MKVTQQSRNASAVSAWKGYCWSSPVLSVRLKFSHYKNFGNCSYQNMLKKLNEQTPSIFVIRLCIGEKYIQAFISGGGTR